MSLGKILHDDEVVRINCTWATYSSSSRNASTLVTIPAVCALLEFRLFHIFCPYLSPSLWLNERTSASLILSLAAKKKGKAKWMNLQPFLFWQSHNLCLRLGSSICTHAGWCLQMTLADVHFRCCMLRHHQHQRQEQQEAAAVKKKFWHAFSSIGLFSYTCCNPVPGYCHFSPHQGRM